MTTDGEGAVGSEPSCGSKGGRDVLLRGAEVQLGQEGRERSDEVVATVEGTCTPPPSCLGGEGKLKGLMGRGEETSVLIGKGGRLC